MQTTRVSIAVGVPGMPRNSRDGSWRPQMSLAVFLDLDGVLTPKAVNLQYATMLGVESELISLEDQYANGLIDNGQFNAGFIPLFRRAGFTLQFAEDNFSRVLLNTFAEEVLQANLPNTFIVTSSPSFYVDQFARKFGIPQTHVVCSRYEFDDSGLLADCVAPYTILSKAEFVRERARRFRVTIGVGDSAEQDGRFLSECSTKILMGGERRNYLHAEDLYSVHTLVILLRSLLLSATDRPPDCDPGVDLLLAQSQYERNVFIMAPLRPDARYIAAIDAMKKELKGGGFRGWTADEIDLGDDLWLNVRCFMHASKYGIALVTADEVEQAHAVTIRRDVYNPNVIVEAGYMLGQGKEVLILKDTRTALPTDLLGRLFRPLNFANPAPEVRAAVQRWLQRRQRAGEAG